ncbi:hypothetical protein FSP39_016789 [Pinctada imbricata]|uniref:Methyltransferase domain-containing protein n=1 Tax=Pinctada imbricata TaxID=66713 RepID=A0AA88Y4Y9_PINIB|nr:hypothetical protein FSP39_016789 [Pinctada imbricata]
MHGEKFHVNNDLEKGEKILKIKGLLKRNLSFLQHYLPFANSHSKDFITHRHWENFLSDSIKSELLSLTDEDLLTLPHTTKVDEMNDDIVKDHNEWEFKCDYFMKSPKVGEKSDIYSREMRNHSPDWIHSNLSSFVSEAQKHTLRRSGILSELSDLASRLGLSDNKDLVFISQYMDKKKSHEVEVMGDVCAALATVENVDMVVDLGSGKGYLSTHLALQHELTVLGVDAQTTNTAGASRRREVLTKQWAGLTRNAKVKNERGDSKKLGKKLKKKMRKLQDEREGRGNTADKGKVNENTNAAEVSEEVMFGVGNLFLDSNREDLTSEEQVDSDAYSIRSQKKEDGIDRQGELATHDCDPGRIEDKDEKVDDSCKGIDYSVYDKTAKHSKSDVKHDSEKAEASQKDKVAKLVASNKKASQHHFPVTLYIDTDTNLIEVIEQTLAANNLELPVRHKEGDITSNRDIKLMITGLHTCGGLGASTMRLFVTCEQAPVLCNVGCCYHLMEEEFVANPFTERTQEKGDEHAGFPMSAFLRNHRVGLGQYARSFASQAVTRRQQDTKLIAKQFPRIMLQAVLSDILGFTSDEWKGLRKLDQKCKDLPEYIHKAVHKLNLPVDQFSEERVKECLDKYVVYQEWFIAYFQLKLVLAPCIEAVVLLDRMLYLLEQDCIDDVMLVQLFDPVKSPRCHAIIAFKKGNQ